MLSLSSDATPVPPIVARSYRPDPSEAAPSSVFDKHYFINPETLNGRQPPSYTRLDPAAALARARSTASAASELADPISTSSSSSKQKRDAAMTISHQTINTTSFYITLDCTTPFNEVADPTGTIPSDTCTKVAFGLKRTAQRLERSIHLPQTVNVKVTFNSFCTMNDTTRLGTACTVSDTIMGYAAPAAFHVFSQTAAASFGLDSNYSYPSSLAKQYAPTDPVLAASTLDIALSLSSDVNWWFATADDPVGWPYNPHWGSFNPVYGGSTGDPIKSFDFEQVAMHEFCHGLGFISSWATWIDSDIFLPSYLDRDSNGNTIIAHPYIFNRWMSDTINQVWLKTYAEIISQGVQSAVATNGNTNWYTPFRNSVAGQTGLAIGASLFRTPCAVASWYPDRDLFSGLPVFKYAYIYTPVKFNSGSSLSHVDANIYAGTSDVLMRPAGTLGAGLDALIPSNQRGGVGEAVLGIMRAMGYVTL